MSQTFSTCLSSYVLDPSAIVPTAAGEEHVGGNGRQDIVTWSTSFYSLQESQISLYCSVPSLSAHVFPMLFVLSTLSTSLCSSFPPLRIPVPPIPAGSLDSSLKVQLWYPSLSLATDSHSSSSVLVSHFLFASAYCLTRARYFIEQLKKSGGEMVNHLICEIKQQKKRRLQKHLSSQGRWEGLCQREDSANMTLLEIATGVQQQGSEGFPETT